MIVLDGEPEGGEVSIGLFSSDQRLDMTRNNQTMQGFAGVVGDMLSRNVIRKATRRLIGSFRVFG